MSPSYLSTRFKKETGASFTEYLIRYRVNKAKNLLKEKQNRCREVAENVGYKDYAQFSKIFKKYVESGGYSTQIAFLEGPITRIFSVKDKYMISKSL